ncbi:NAD(P)/FAD-dependent oxidoreductase [Streptomyces sp. NPDC001177]
MRGLLVVGGGPGGPAAAVDGASEGLDTALIDAAAFGGQAGTSSRIENYLGFPAGLPAAELAARGAIQATKFGVELRRNARATAFVSHDGLHAVRCDDGRVCKARDVMIATGAEYRRLAVPGIEAWEGNGVYYAATVAEARHSIGRPVAVIGGANSAGQAAMFLSRTSDLVHLVVRSQDLDHSMSRYLIDAIASNPKIQVRVRTEAVGITGGSAVTGLEAVDPTTEKRSALEVARSSCSLVPPRAQAGSTPNWRWTPRASCSPGTNSTLSHQACERRFPLKPVCPASSASATCAAEASSGSLQLSARAPRRFGLTLNDGEPTGWKSHDHRLPWPSTGAGPVAVRQGADPGIETLSIAVGLRSGKHPGRLRARAPESPRDTLNTEVLALLRRGLRRRPRMGRPLTAAQHNWSGRSPRTWKGPGRPPRESGATASVSGAAPSASS